MPRSCVRGTKASGTMRRVSAQLPLPGQANSMREQDGATRLTLPNGWRIRQLGGHRGGRAPAAVSPSRAARKGVPKGTQGPFAVRILKARHGTCSERSGAQRC